MKDAAGVGNPCARSFRLPGREQVCTLRSGGITVEQQFPGTDVVTLPDIGQSSKERAPGPLLRLPVIIVPEPRADKEDPVPVGPFAPAEPPGGICPAVGIAPAEKNQNPPGSGLLRIIILWNPEVDCNRAVLRRARFDLH